MKYDEFLDTVKVLKMLYGRNYAEEFFMKNIGLYYNLNTTDLKNAVANDDDLVYDDTNASIKTNPQKV